MQINRISSYANYYNNQENPNFEKTIKTNFKLPKSIKTIKQEIKIPKNIKTIQSGIKIPESLKSRDAFKKYLIEHDSTGILGFIIEVKNETKNYNKKIEPEHIKILKKNNIKIDNINEIRTFKEKRILYKMTELQWQCRKGNREIVNALLKLDDIDVNAKDEYGETALMYASSSLHNTGIIEDLLKVKDIDVNAQDNEGWSAFMYSALKGDTEAVKLYIKDGRCDINAQNKNGITSHHITNLYGFYDILKLINNESI